ncbi:hypothetical protein DFH08DRAFT_823632 [Mycena albidolilacea]|uniref:Uncharacterized protein n=1 Tax=Mycena albidolilacea TaxID=1033008 RepID=A0AAD6Z6V8_9AGAR|nr:hypothetical protein DFH08DRAFT_823632 [Mycena albidolilacea]
MSSPLHNFAFFWSLGLRFFLNPRMSPRCRLDWDTQNADGTPLLLGYGVEDFRRPHRFFHEQSDGVSAILAFGFDAVGGGVSGPEPAPQTDGFLRLWLATFAARAGFCIFLELSSSLVPGRNCTSTLPGVRLVVVLTSFDAYCQSQRDHIHEDCLRNHLFRVVLHMERVLFWLSRMGFGVAWSERYNQLLVRLFPEVYPDTPEANRESNLAGLHPRLLSFHRPEGSPRHGPASFEALPGITRIRLISTREPNVRSGFRPSPDSTIHSVQGEAVRFSTEGVLEYLDVGDELDLKIIAAGLSPSNFFGATLPNPPPPPLPTPAPSPQPPPRLQSQTGYFLTSPRVSSREISFEGGGGAHFFPSLQVLQQQRVFVHFGGGVSVIRQNPAVLLALQGGTYLLPWLDQILQCVRGRQQRDLERVLGVALGAPQGWIFFAPATRPSVVGLAADLSASFHQHLFFPLGLSTTYREFLLLRPEPRATGSSTRRSSVVSASDSGVETSESETPACKRRKMSRPQNTRRTRCPEVVEVTNEDDAPATADDPWNYDFELEPAPDTVPMEQQASSSCMTLDDPPPRDAHFLGFRPRPAAEIASASCASLVEEILQQSAEDVEGEEQLESALLAMSEVFEQAGRLLRRGDKGKGKGRAS